jgi:hypothetical protein
MILYKCDWCGKIQDVNTMTGKQELECVGSCSIYAHERPQAGCMLCPDCLKRLIRYLENGGKES